MCLILHLRLERKSFGHETWWVEGSSLSRLAAVLIRHVRSDKPGAIGSADSAGAGPSFAIWPCAISFCKSSKPPMWLELAISTAYAHYLSGGGTGGSYTGPGRSRSRSRSGSKWASCLASWSLGVLQEGCKELHLTEVWNMYMWYTIKAYIYYICMFFSNSYKALM